MKLTPSKPAPLTLEVLTSRLSDCGAQLIGSTLSAVTHMTEDSRLVQAGSLFVARRGEKSDGTRFAKSAIEKGAVAVLCAPGTVDVEPRIEVSELRRAWGLAAHELWGRPSEVLAVVGITGTNGKTTVASLVCQALESLGRPTARSGTLGFFIGDEKLSDSLTTPQPDQLAAALAAAVTRQAEVAVLEVSSHALDQERIAGVTLEVAALTNLTQDHLDYHGTMQAYGEAKAKLFTAHGARHQVLNHDDALGRSLKNQLPDALCISTESGANAQIRTESVEFSRTGIVATLRVRDESVALRSALLGRHNLENLLVALGILLTLGVELEAATRALGQARGVAGRLERCEVPGDDISVVVDYAHTPDALERALGTLVALDYQEVICVFGCGGDRDRKKRVPMGQAAARFADLVVLTSDNPRTEDPENILQEVRPGLTACRRPPQVEVDRRRAIESAVLAAQPGAVVLIAGKGHEDYQLVGEQVLKFDDRVEARRALEKRRVERKES